MSRLKSGQHLAGRNREVEDIVAAAEDYHSNESIEPVNVDADYTQEVLGVLNSPKYKEMFQLYPKPA